MRIPVAPHPCQHAQLSVILILGVLIDMQWYLICINYKFEHAPSLLKSVHLPIALDKALTL